MKREYLVMNMLAVHRYMQRINAQIIRMKPVRRHPDEEAYVVLYIER